MNQSPKVSIITVNYNGTDVTAALLRSLQQLTYPSWEVVVVDNGSRVPCRSLAAEFPWIKYVEAGANLGFAGGNNLGQEAADGDYILLLNNDTEVDPGFLEPLVARLQGDKSIGVVSPKLLYFDEPQTLQFAGFTPIHPVTGRGFCIGNLEKDNGQYDTAAPTSRAHGAAMMYPRRVLDQVGPMAELYFLYYEEMDYCEQIKRAGYSIWYEPASRVWHKESMSTGKNSPLKTYYYSRNRLLYLRRNTFGRHRLPMLGYYYGVAVPKNLLQHLAGREWSHLAAFWKGLVWNFRNGKTDRHDKN
ncbi:glycosyltransferase family 2 protein [Paraflavisolibacter sp. H34]|uniref:glycosyltransferase family 2 protein n=1 Tax=Huijunlia imazamoxiresistens TaxID=3127457 RepID=UPI00301ACCBD